MKRISLLNALIIISSFVSHINAELVSIDVANNIANEFLNQTQRKKALSTWSVDSFDYAWNSNNLFECNSAINSALSSSSESTFYVFSNESSFIIISAESNTRQIIGYSFEGPISSASNIPEPMREYLSGIDTEIKYARNNSASNTPIINTLAEPTGSVVKLIETANWGQGAPYNRLCVTSSGATAKTGCIPTAFSIVMYHHKWPEVGTGNLYNGQTGELITDRNYDWAKMLKSYSETYTEQQANAVAKLMSDVGHAYMVSYGTGTTTGNTGGSTDKLAKYFGYKNVSSTLGNATSEDDWYSLIKSSLQNDCPIPYESTNSGTGDSKHAFVLDGYTTDNYFHFNWGWNGYQNGYFTLSAMLPGDGDNYSGISNHKAFFNLEPDKKEYQVVASAEPSNAGLVSINGGKYGTTATASKYENATVTLTAVANDGYAFSNWTKNGDVVSTSKSFSTSVTSNIANNTYVANFTEANSASVTYEVMHSTGTKTNTNGARSSTWTYSTSAEFPVALQLKSTNNSTELYGISNSYDRYYAYAYDSNDTGYNTVTYTLSVPEGYIITDYDITYWVSNSYKGQVTISNDSGSNTPNNTDDQYFKASNINNQSTSFTLSASKSGQQFITVESFTVTIKPDSGSTTPNTYRVSVTASTGGTAYASATEVEDGDTVTLTATPASGYEFEHWCVGTTIVSTENPYTTTITENTEFIAKFKTSVSDIEGIYTTDTQIYAENGIIFINGYTGYIKVITPTGQIIKDTYVNESTQLSVNNGVYLVITNGRTTKIIV